jgi:small subunit ribosomal protein S2
MVFTLSIYINCSKIEEANEALKKSLHQVEKYYLLLPKNKQKTSLLKSKSCKHALHQRWPGGMLTNFVTIRKAVKNGYY